MLNKDKNQNYEEIKFISLSTKYQPKRRACIQKWNRITEIEWNSWKINSNCILCNANRVFSNTDWPEFCFLHFHFNECLMHFIKLKASLKYATLYSFHWPFSNFICSLFLFYYVHCTISCFAHFWLFSLSLFSAKWDGDLDCKLLLV